MEDYLSIFPKRVYLEQDFSTHGFAVSDDGFFVAAFAIPAIELDTSIKQDITASVSNGAYK